MSVRGNGSYLGPRPTGPTATVAGGWWDLRNQFRYKREATWPSVNDPNFSSVSLLLHFDGTNGSTTFTDSSSNAHAVTAVGNSQISTAQSKFGGASGLFDGAGDYLTIGSSSAFAYGTGDFTWEAWGRYISLPSNGYLFDHGSNGGTISYFSDVLRYFNATVGTGSVLYTSGWGALTTGVWYHIAAVRQSGTTKLYLDGVEKTSAADSHNYGNQALRICGHGGGGLEPNMYVDDLRLTKGVARYTAAFTPPADPFPNA